MDGKGSLSLEFLDVSGNHPNDRADVFLSHTVLSHSVHIKDALTSKKLKINDLDSTQGGTYRLQVFTMRRYLCCPAIPLTFGELTRYQSVTAHFIGEYPWESEKMPNFLLPQSARISLGPAYC